MYFHRLKLKYSQFLITLIPKQKLMILKSELLFKLK